MPKIFLAACSHVKTPVINSGIKPHYILESFYVRYEYNGWGSTVTKIGNILNDKWFDIKEFFAEK